LGNFKDSIYTNSYGGKIWVSEIIPMGAADKNGQIQVGDILLTVDEVRLCTKLCHCPQKRPSIVSKET
jgi:hypothetical protein